jgi:hypothetical protein
VLSGPEVLSASGAWVMTDAAVQRLDQGELHLEVFTRAHPAGAARAQIAVPVR